MIKNLLNADEEPPPGTKVVIEDSVVSPGAQTPGSQASRAVENSAETAEKPAVFEIPADAGFFTNPAESAPLDEGSESLDTLTADIENLDDKDLDALERKLAAAQIEQSTTEPASVEPLTAQTEKTPFDEPARAEKTDNPLPDMIFQSSYKPPSTAETIRNSGLAWSAGVVLFGSVIFMMILGWFADLLLGSSPYGLVGGIVLGGLIGIVQLFRISSQIYRK